MINENRDLIQNLIEREGASSRQADFILKTLSTDKQIEDYKELKNKADLASKERIEKEEDKFQKGLSDAESQRENEIRKANEKYENKVLKLNDKIREEREIFEKSSKRNRRESFKTLIQRIKKIVEGLGI